MSLYLLTPRVLCNTTENQNLIIAHLHSRGNTFSEDDLRRTAIKFLTTGVPVAIVTNNEIIAFSQLNCTFTEQQDAYLCNVFVAPEFRGMGLSKILLHFASAQCLARGFKTISLHVAKGNLRAMSLYKKFGFAITGSIKERNGEKLVEMRLKL